MSRDYEKMFDKFMDYEKTLHEKNQKKITIGLKINVFLPLVFLLFSFLVPSARFMFLMLWIISLFGIAFYLIYVEYSDYKMQKTLQELGAIEKIEQDDLMGDTVEEVEKAFDERVSIIEDRIDDEKARLETELARLSKEKEKIDAEHKKKLESILRGKK